MTKYWFDSTALSGGRTSGLPARRRRKIEAFADANDLGYDVWVKGDMPGLLFSAGSMCKDVVATRSHPHVEFGNHGWKVWKDSDDGTPSRQGYIAVRHELALPQVLISPDGRTGAATVLAMASRVINVAGMFNVEDDSGGDPSPFESFRSRGVEVPLPEQSGFSVFSAPGEQEHASRLLTGSAASDLAWLATSFSIETTDSWLFAYSHFGDLSTTEAEVWAWAFSAASRLIDLLDSWRGSGPHVSQPTDQANVDVSQLGFYTRERIERPRQLDGSLRFLKRGS